MYRMSLSPCCAPTRDASTQVCVQKVQPYLQVFEPEAIEVVTVGSTDLLWSATTTAMFCATLSIMWLFVGYRGGMMIGTRYKGLYPVI